MSDTAYLGFAHAARGPHAALEHDLLTQADAASVAHCARTLAARPHIAGTPAQAATRDFVLERMHAWGLETDVAEYEVYLPHPVAARLERITPRPRTFALTEPPLAEARGSADPLQWPAWHGYAVAGDVRGELVYVNYAREADLNALAACGVSLAGRIAVARYGELFRGQKVLNVQHRGAIGCLLYSDPLDDGYCAGEVFPAGPMRPAGGVQRGSLNLGAGDPTSPDAVAKPGVLRRPPADSPHLPNIPSLPIGYAAALELLQHIAGPDAPAGWQGGLPFRYRMGPGPVQARLAVLHDGGYRRIWNTFGRIVGADSPDECVILGAHRDAWGCGAIDNVSGVASVLEAARLCAAAARAGRPAKRTLVFATWDAEEWGLIGSTEWVKEHRDELLSSAVAYLNQDIAAGGPDFAAGGSPSLGGVMREIARLVPSPDAPGQSVHQTWARDSGEAAPFTQPGGGSDHEAFLFHLGLPCASFGFGGKWGNYHSAYDTSEWVERSGDPGYRRQTASGVLSALLALRLANADVLPLDFVPYAAAVREGLRPIVEGAARAERLRRVELGPLDPGLREFEAAAKACAARMREADVGQWSGGARALLNGCLRCERLLVRLAGMPAPDGDRFHRNLVFGIDPRTSYGAWRLPGLRRHLEAGDADGLAREADALRTALCWFAARLRQGLAATT